MKETKQKRAVLNTTIREDVLENFRNYCYVINCPMNIVLEAFMNQFANKEFDFKLIKNKMKIEEVVKEE